MKLCPLFLPSDLTWRHSNTKTSHSRYGIWEARQVSDLTGVVTSRILVIDVYLSSFVDAVIFVVDSADIDRLNIAKAELAAILKV